MCCCLRRPSQQAGDRIHDVWCHHGRLGHPASNVCLERVLIVVASVGWLAGALKHAINLLAYKGEDSQGVTHMFVELGNGENNVLEMAFINPVVLVCQISDPLVELYNIAVPYNKIAGL